MEAGLRTIASVRLRHQIVINTFVAISIMAHRSQRANAKASTWDQSTGV